MAMARPRRSPREAQLLPLAASEIGAQGSRSAQGSAIAAEVARIAVLDVTGDDDDPAVRLEIASARVVSPAVAQLALDPDIDTATIVMRAAVNQFEASGYRRIPPSEWSMADEALRAEVADRLATRYRKALK